MCPICTSLTVEGISSRRGGGDAADPHRAGPGEGRQKRDGGRHRIDIDVAFQATPGQLLAIDAALDAEMNVD
jgi:hypothetical protein